MKSEIIRFIKGEVNFQKWTTFPRHPSSHFNKFDSTVLVEKNKTIRKLNVIKW